MARRIVSVLVVAGPTTNAVISGPERTLARTPPAEGPIAFLPRIGMLHAFDLADRQPRAIAGHRP